MSMNQIRAIRHRLLSFWFRLNRPGNKAEAPELPIPKHLLPSGTFDTHVHIFDSEVGPFHPSRAYTPAEAPWRDLQTFLAGLSSTGKSANVVLVQPSPYRDDNSVLLTTLKTLQNDPSITARGIAVIDFQTATDDELWEMHRLGVRGIRLNLQADGHEIDINGLLKSLKIAARRVSILPDWKIQIYCPSRVWTDLYEEIQALPVEVIADHLGGLLGASKLAKGEAKHADTINQPGFESLIALAKSSHVLIKVSGLYRASDLTDQLYGDLEPIVRRLAEEVPERLLWGSDWPHTGEGKDRAAKKSIGEGQSIENFRTIDNAGVLKNLHDWVGSPAVWEQMTARNPARVFK